MTEGSVLLWVRRAPYSTAHLSEAIRVAAMGTALGLPLRMLFIADGVRALVAGQEPHRLGPPIEKTLRDIVTVERPALVHAPSLRRRGLEPLALASGVPVRLIEDDEAAQWVLDAARTVPL
ncbi:MAG TPA: DsrE family protein [Thermoplasmata archaeon]|nr:DsrE family protein [Thermoplasmata archaeon]